MEKTLDTLVLLHRTLLLVAATILLIVAGQIRQSDEVGATQAQAVQIGAVTSAFQRFKGDAAEAYTAAYRPLFAQAMRRQPADLRTALERAQYWPPLLVVKGRTFWFSAPGEPGELLSSLVELVRALPPPEGLPEASFPAPALDAKDLQARLAEARASGIYARYLGAPDLVILVYPPEPDGRCMLVFKSRSVGDSLSPRNVRVLCKAGPGVPAGPLLGAYAASTWPTALGVDPATGTTPDGRQLNLLYRSWPEALKRADAASEAARKLVEEGSAASVELAGVSADRSLALLVAPLLLIVVLLLMMGSTATARRLSAHEPLAGGHWWAQFLGSQFVLLASLTLVLGGTAVFFSVNFATDNWLDYPESLSLAIGLALLASGLGSAVLWANWGLAQAWDKRMLDAARQPVVIPQPLPA